MTEFISCETESGREKIVPGLVYKIYAARFSAEITKMQIVLCAEENCYGYIVAKVFKSSGVLRNTQIISVHGEYRP